MQTFAQILDRVYRFLVAQSSNYTAATLVHKDTLMSSSVKTRLQVRQHLEFEIRRLTLMNARVEFPGPNFMVENMAHHKGTCLHVFIAAESEPAACEVESDPSLKCISSKHVS